MPFLLQQESCPRGPFADARGWGAALRRVIDRQLLEYKRKEGVWARPPAVWINAKVSSAADVWAMYGTGQRELQIIAMRALAQPSGAASAERGHKAMNFVLRSLRNKLEYAKTESLMYIAMNLDMLNKREEIMRRTSGKASVAALPELHDSDEEITLDDGVQEAFTMWAEMSAAAELDYQAKQAERKAGGLLKKAAAKGGNIRQKRIVPDEAEAESDGEAAAPVGQAGAAAAAAAGGGGRSTRLGRTINKPRHFALIDSD